MIRVITFGTFDLFHIGHLRLLERARALGDHLTVGVSTDKLNYSKKAAYPFHPETDRAEIVGGLRCVDAVFFEHSLELKADYIREHRADLLVMGHDWEGRFDEMKAYCDVVYLPRTEGICSTDIRAKLSAQGGR
jgi:glycerol-3-phosphate cytidylyltransferase